MEKNGSRIWTQRPKIIQKPVVLFQDEKKLILLPCVIINRKLNKQRKIICYLSIDVAKVLFAVLDCTNYSNRAYTPCDIIFQTGCGRHMDEKVLSHGQMSTDLLNSFFCARVYKDATEISNNGFTNEQKDLFMEQRKYSFTLTSNIQGVPLTQTPPPQIKL